MPSQASPHPSPPAGTRNGEIPFADFAQPPSRLYRDFLVGSSRADEFFSPGGWNLDTLAEAADRAGSLQRPHEALASALVAQQEPRSPAAAQQASRLTAADAAVVVTGQQAVLFGGPLYVLYKAVAVVKLAAQLEARRGRPVVPVFWVASDDHDFAEIRSVTLMDSDGRLRSLRYAPTREPVGEPASQIILEPSIDRLFEEAERCLPDSPHKATVIDALRACYRPGVSIATAFAAWISRVLPGLVVIDPSDPSLKKLIMPVLRKEMSEASPSSRAAASIGPRLAAAGYHQQVPVREGFFNLFAHLDGHRRAVAERDGGLEVRGTDVRMTVQEAVALLEEDPSLWSPGVLLRPLAQDLLLPTAGYVGGPSEVAYHAQIGPAYEQFGIPRPVLLPRPSATLVEPPQARALESEGLSLVDLQGEPEPLLTRWTREAYPEVEAAFAKAKGSIEAELQHIEETLGAVDPTLRGAAGSARGRALHQIETLHQKAVRALKKRDRTRADRLRRTRDALFPGGAFQERGLAWVGSIARHGAGLVGEIEERLDPWARGHQTLYL